jgi:ribosomal-protein-alanine N-acetyltransferase
MSTRRALELRPPARADRDAFLDAMRASRELHRPWLSAPVTEVGFAEWLGRSRDPSFDANLLCSAGDGEILGFFNLSNIIRGSFQNAYLSYAAAAAHARQGHMTAGLELLLRRAFSELGLHRLEANIQPGNIASAALVRRCGFVREGLSERYLKINGRWRDHERWAIRREQWQAQRESRPAGT